MTQDEIIKMARETLVLGPYESATGFNAENAIKFAKLVAEHEREACAKIAETPIGEYEVIVACGTEPTPHRIPQYSNWQDLAKAIRARGQA
jgi:hypothetical protein